MISKGPQITANPTLQTASFTIHTKPGRAPW